MLIVKIQANENGAHANQSCSFALPTLPEGWAAVPPELEQAAAELLPWVTLEMEGGAIVGVSDNPEARAAAANAPVSEPDTMPTQLDRVEAQATYTAMMTDTLMEV